MGRIFNRITHKTNPEFPEGGYIYEWTCDELEKYNSGKVESERFYVSGSNMGQREDGKWELYPFGHEYWGWMGPLNFDYGYSSPEEAFEGLREFMK